MALAERSTRDSVSFTLTTRATRDPGRAFLRPESGGVLSYGEVDGQAEALAAALAQLGVEERDRVALVLPVCPEFVVATLAAAKLGAVIVPLDPRLSRAELQYTLRHSEAVCAVTAERAYGVDYLQLFEDLMVELPELQYLVTVGKEDLWYDDRIFQLEDLLSAGRGRDYPAPDIDPVRDCFALVYTSGTTGKPKGVMLSHRNLVSAGQGVAEALGLTEDDRVAGIASMFHVFGLVHAVLATMEAGASVILRDDPDAAETLDSIQSHGATVLYGVPTGFIAALAEQEAFPRRVSTLRVAVVAGAPVRPELIDHVRTMLCPTVVVAYSLTEASSTVCIPRLDDPPEKQKVTVGTPLPGMDLRIREQDGSALPVESVGEIGLRGPGVMLGYHRQPGLTREAFDADGYLLTGDLGMVDEEGYVHLVGRRKEVIIRSGFNVYPREVESRLEAHPAVQEAAALGVSDPFLGEAICACVVPVEGAIVSEHEIVEWCRETLAASRVPDQVRFLDSFPRTGTGKVRRIELARLIQSTGRPA